ncbi:MAG: hypothetical protein A2103_03780 [Gammaproteobacteria bacterium GWF2_41_13]|nr:MAG: hypothetical protein A2103_03780 [Gammaproteobacteria bacterium GWF2_41_13]
MFLKTPLTVFALLLLLIGCGGGSSNNLESADVSPNNGESQCAEPQNPYIEGTGHYAGFEWAMNNGGACDGNSESFNEGCQEYFQQEDDYSKCVDSDDDGNDNDSDE